MRLRKIFVLETRPGVLWGGRVYHDLAGAELVAEHDSERTDEKLHIAEYRRIGRIPPKKAKLKSV
jgi:hypothetical protein